MFHLKHPMHSEFDASSDKIKITGNISLIKPLLNFSGVKVHFPNSQPINNSH